MRVCKVRALPPHDADRHASDLTAERREESPGQGRPFNRDKLGTLVGIQPVIGGKDAYKSLASAYRKEERRLRQFGLVPQSVQLYSTMQLEVTEALADYKKIFLSRMIV